MSHTYTGPGSDLEREILELFALPGCRILWADQIQSYFKVFSLVQITGIIDQIALRTNILTMVFDGTGARCGWRRF